MKENLKQILLGLQEIKTHAGLAHMDEMVAIWALRRAISKAGGDPYAVNIRRVFKVTPEDYNSSTIVLDIGGGEFDHHQADVDVRPNGIKFAAAGLIWRLVGEFLAESQEVAQIFDASVIQAVDAWDNGQSSTDKCQYPIVTLAQAVGAFNPDWDSNKDPSTCFGEALSWVSEYLDKALEGAKSKVRAKSIVEDALAKSEGGVLVLKQFAPWQEWLFASQNPAKDDVQYVVFPSNRGGYNVQGVPTTPGGRTLRKALPEAWRGKSGQELADISGIPGLSFCHAAGFMAAADSIETAMVVAKKAIEA